MKAVRYFGFRVLFVLAAVLLGAVSVGYGRVIYVDDDANGLNDGSSWVNAYKYLQDALADANSGEKPVEIRVAQGIYKPDRSSAQPNGTGDREATFRLLNSVTLRGGYAGSSVPDPNARDVSKYETILSGDLAGNDSDVNNPENLLAEPTRSENSYHVMTGSLTDATAFLDGFTTTAGNANGSYPNNNGGGMYNDMGSPTLTNCKFIVNSAGKGGGISNSENHPTLVGCKFIGNSAQDGGAIWCNLSSPLIMDCNIIGNTASWRGGAIYVWDGYPIIRRCLLTENTAVFTGGAISCGGNQDPTVEYCTISRNSASMAGGIFLSCGSTTTKSKIDHCMISGNKANYHYYGGGIQLMGAGFTREESTHNGGITNCVIVGNSTGIAIQGGGWIINNCTVTTNKYYGIYYNASNNSLLANSILWNNGVQLYIGTSVIGGPSSSYVIVSYSDIKGGLEEVEVHLARWLDWKDSNIDVDPCFAGPGYWDPNGTPNDIDDDFGVDGDYHLKSQTGRWDPKTQIWVKDDVTSPCIDAGDPMSPIGEEPFPNGGRINMGAYGGTAEASKSYFGKQPCETIVAGDINGDCKVDFVDFMFMATHWMDDERDK